jgi:hypothetical protein
MGFYSYSNLDVVVFWWVLLSHLMAWLRDVFNTASSFATPSSATFHYA